MMESPRNDDRPEFEPRIFQGLGQAVPQVAPPIELRSRVLQSVLPRAQAQSPRRRTSPAWLATAASLVLAAGLTVYAVQLRHRVTTLEAELRQTQERADSTQRQMVDAHRAAAGAQTAVGVLTAPDVARVDLAGLPAAPGASARAFWSRSRGMVFTASNLPSLPAGRAYQLWVVTDRAAISAGLLDLDSQGRVNQMFVTPQDIPQPVAMAVTIEPAGGVPAPTGDKYLVGTL